MTRRAFLKDLGHGTLAVAVLGFTVVSCASAADDPTTTSSTGDSTPSTTDAPDTTSPPTTGGSESPTWERVVLGGVSAYLLVRAGEVVIVDTGNPGDEGDIEASLQGIGHGWDDVSHVILTHLHGDHIGSLGPVMEAAASAQGYAGAPDLPSIPSPRALEPVGDGDSVFGLDIIAAPGHTPGSIAILDPIGGVLVAGDAMNGADGGVIGANPRFTQDMEEANRSIAKLAGLGFDTLFFGHGDPVLGGAAAQVAALAAELTQG
ncbi:MAG: MBL fold metallo-hydrolase [Acidimicrobiia bacterium]|nr:MBL fold metallo-hydrolase [Acidimicrobiia bacterium]